MVKKSRELDFACRAAREAGSVLMSHYGRVRVRYKSDRSVVTEADLESEKLIKSLLESEFPNYSFIGEESGREDKDAGNIWVVDPLDGTTNYMIKNPFFGVSIGLIVNGSPLLGVVYYPFLDELFWAEKKKGAFLNDEKIHVSKKERVEDSVVSFCNNRGEEAIKRMAPIFLDIKLVTNKFRQLGAGGLELCYVASGRTESFIMPDANIWDVAAGALIVSEACGRVTDFRGAQYSMKSRDVLASNGWTHDQMLRLLKDK
jgi:myo-inositol-1(or 4)-monophosphatase